MVTQTPSLISRASNINIAERDTAKDAEMHGQLNCAHSVARTKNILC